MGKKKSLISGLKLSLKLVIAVLFMFSVIACQTGTSLTKDAPDIAGNKTKRKPLCKCGDNHKDNTLSQ